jgi:hypothetical protein
MPLLFWYPIIIWSGLFGVALETLPARKRAVECGDTDRAAL